MSLKKFFDWQTLCKKHLTCRIVWSLTSHGTTLLSVINFQNNENKLPTYNIAHGKGMLVSAIKKNGSNKFVHMCYEHIP